MSDLKLAIRQLLKSPGFTIVAVLSLTIGIGASTAIFSVLNAVRLRSLPVREPHQLRVFNWIGLNPHLGSYTGTGKRDIRGGFRSGSSFPYPAYREFCDRNSGFDSVFAFFPLPRLIVMARGEAITGGGMMVSGNYFTSYGASTLIGRPLAPEDDQPGAAPVAVITYRMWEQQFGLDPHALGQTVSLNQNAFTVVGVLAREYAGPIPGDWPDVYVPLAAQPALASSRPLDSANHWWVQVMGRLAPGVDEQQAQAALTVLFRQVLAGSKSKMDQPGILLESGARGAGSVLRDRMAKPLWALLAAVGLVLMVACANVAGLLVARGAARHHEFAVRAAIGASRWRLVRQSLTESLLLGLAAGAGGLLLAHWGKAALLQGFGGMPDSFRFDTRTDATVLAFTLGVSVLTALIFGLLPALRASRADPVSGLKSRAVVAPRLRLGRLLVAVQMGIAVLLVVGAGLMVHSFASLVRVDPGFNAENVLLFRVDPKRGGYKGDALAGFYAEARRSLEAIPGVSSVALTSIALVSGSAESYSIQIPGRTGPSDESPEINMVVASDSFFETLGIPVLLGRDFSTADTASSLPVVVVNETFARTCFPDENPLGRTFLLQDGRGRTFTIIGVARDAKYSTIRETIPPVAFFSNQQHERGAMVFAVRSVLPPLSIVPAARKAIAALNPNVPLSAVRTLKDLVTQSTLLDRLFAGLCTGLAGIALLLACVGLYGLMAYNVARRTGEFGIRMALGASRRDIAAPILRDAILLAGLGVAVGVPVALALARLARGLLYGVEWHDPMTLIASVLVLLLVALAAAWIPARRAGKVEPMEALRAE